MPFRNSFTKSVILLSSCILSFLLAELAARGWHAYQQDRSLSLPSLLQQDSELGWGLRHYTYKGEKNLQSLCGESLQPPPYWGTVLVKVAAHPSSPQTKKTTLLVIGDSYTHARRVSYGYAYYDTLERLAGKQYAVFAAGIAGYSNLQEYLALEKVFSQVKPTLLIWQLADNDPSDNRFLLDKTNPFQQRSRPYLNLQTEGWELKHPGSAFYQISWLARQTYIQLNMLDRTYNWQIFRPAQLPFAQQQAEQKKGLQVLAVLLGKLHKNHQKLQVVGFSATRRYDQQFQQIFQKEGYYYLADFDKELRTTTGNRCRKGDDHWNYQGNEQAGKQLYRQLLALGLLQ